MFGRTNRRLIRSIRAVTAAAAAVLLCVPPTHTVVVPTAAPAPPSVPPVAVEGGSEMDEIGLGWNRQEWFFAQRAFPTGRIPHRALLRARQEARDLERSGAFAAASRDAALDVNWVSLGPRPILKPGGGGAPWSGRVTSVAHDPSNPQVLYLGSAGGGLWRSSDAGVTWAPTSDGLPSLAIGAVAVAGGTVYAGTGEANYSTDSYYGAGLFRSTNGGAGWWRTGGSTFDGCHISDILSRPGTPATVLVAVHAAGVQGATSCSSRAGVYRTTNGGGAWAKVLTGPATDLAVSPAASATVFAGISGSGVYRSTTAGTSWSKLSGLPTTNVERVAVAVAPTNPKRVYTAMSNMANGTLLGLWTSANGGGSWTRLTADADFCAYPSWPVGQCWFDLALAVDPGNAGTFYAGGINLYRYTDNGTRRTRIGIGSDGIHVDIHALVFDATKRLLVGTDGGVYRTADAGATFANLNATLSITQFNPGLAGALAGPLLGGTQDNGSVVVGGAGSWTQVLAGDGGPAAVDPTNPATMYVTYQFLNVLKSVNGGASFADADAGISTSDPREFIAPFVMSPTDPKTLFAGTNRVWRSTNGGATWNAISAPFGASKPACCVTAIAPARSSPNVIYAGTFDGKVMLTRNGGGSWTNVATRGLPVRTVTDVFVHPANANTAYVALSGFGTAHLWRTTDGGASWRSVSNGLPNTPVNAVAVDAATTPARVFVGTDVGVFGSPDAGATWTRLGKGLPNVVVMDLRLDPAADSLVAATHGRGVFVARI